MRYPGYLHITLFTKLSTLNPYRNLKQIKYSNCFHNAYVAGRLYLQTNFANLLKYSAADNLYTIIYTQCYRLVSKFSIILKL